MIRLGNSYLHYTKNIKGVQKGRIESTLDKLHRIAGLGTLSLKDWMVQAYLAGAKVYVDNEYSYYSRRTGEMTKPKVAYFVEYPDGSTYDIPKTGHDFFNYVVNSNAKEKDIVNFLATESKNAENERLRIEKEERIRREAEQRQRELQKEQFRQKVAEEERQGLPIIQPHLPYLINLAENYAKDNNIQISNFDAEIKIPVTKEFARMCGNPKVMKGAVEYHVQNPDLDTRKVTVGLYRPALIHLLGVTREDSGQTVSAKIRAFLEGREYVPAKKKEVEKITTYKRMKNTFIEIEAERMPMKGVDVVISRAEGGGWSCTERLTGLLLVSGLTKAEAITKLKEVNNLVEKVNKAHLRAATTTGFIPMALGEGNLDFKRKHSSSMYINDKALELKTVGTCKYYITKIGNIFVAYDASTCIPVNSAITVDELNNTIDKYVRDGIYDKIIAMVDKELSQLD